MQTFRRLNDAERYWGLSWRGWVGVGAAGGLLYGAVRLSPIPTKPTITIAVLVLALLGTVLYSLSGQALGPARFALAFVSYLRARKQLGCPLDAGSGGLVLDAAPPEPTDIDVESEPVF